jgi:hypothetical protein
VTLYRYRIPSISTPKETGLKSPARVNVTTVHTGKPDRRTLLDLYGWKPKAVGMGHLISKGVIYDKYFQKN